MNIVSTSKARQRLAQLVNMVRYTNRPVAIGRHNKAEVLLIKFPENTSPAVDQITNMNQYGGAFDFLADEPDLYSRKDVKKAYV